jgi:hypothetical protein
MIAVNQSLANAVVERCNPHCFVWVKVHASLWGMSNDHDLDEPVRLSDEVPMRLRLVGHHSYRADRELSFLTKRAGTHLAVRFYFRDGSFHETEIDVSHTSRDEKVTVS